MPGRILGFDFGRAAQTTASPLSRPAIEKRTSTTRQSNNSGLTGLEGRRDSMEHFKRPSIAKIGRNSSSEKKDKPRERNDTGPAKHVKLEIVAESPPALFLDDPVRSSGALYSLKLKLVVKEKPVTLTSFHLHLNAISSTKKPVVERCPDCSAQSSTIKDWNFIRDPTTFQPGEHEFPASLMLPGHIPVTTHGHFGSIDYRFEAKAVSNKSETFEIRKPLTVSRALRPGADKNSVRIFPPTNLTLNVTLPSIVHPIGDFNVYARMSGITTKRDDTQTRWRLRKMTWKIEEKETSISPACSKHSQKVGGEGKGIAHEHTRDLGEEELKQGWKTDFEDGQIEGEFVCSIDSTKKPNVDVEAPNGLKITHTLILELVIAEEWASNRKPTHATPTGAARVLRTQFNLVVTERAGMGIAWDDEQPPLYEDVPASPPAYLHVEDYSGDDLNEDVEHLRLGP